jgi:flagellar motor switch protein FliN
MTATMDDARSSSMDQLPRVEPRPSAPLGLGVAHAALLKIPVNVQVVLGQVRMALSDVMALGPGSVVMLESGLSDPVALMVNGNEVARGVIMVADEKTGQLAISLTSVAGSQGSRDAG